MEQKNKTTTPGNSRDPRQRTIVQDFLDRGEDPFARKNIEQIFIEKDGQKIYNRIIHETASWYAIPNLWPLAGAEQHLVTIVQRDQVSNLRDLYADEWRYLRWMLQELCAKFTITAGAFCMRFGDPKIAGTTVTHLHGHLLKAVPDGTIGFPIGAFENPGVTIESNPQSVTYHPDQGDWTSGIHQTSPFALRMELKHSPLCSLWDLTDKEWKYLRQSILANIALHEISGGAMCIRFDQVKGMDIWLLSPTQKMKFIFEIKN